MTSACVCLFNAGFPTLPTAGGLVCFCARALGAGTVDGKRTRAGSDVPDSSQIFRPSPQLAAFPARALGTRTADDEIVAGLDNSNDDGHHRHDAWS
mmetsp:Transcript_37017/g.105808  ORF Transcript_37017/g.105808 Transcript_37017/m.105808 type:complete len:96 (-) Transcript_37017:17-304(-)